MRSKAGNQCFTVICVRGIYFQQSAKVTIQYHYATMGHSINKKLLKGVKSGKTAQNQGKRKLFCFGRVCGSPRAYERRAARRHRAIAAIFWPNHVTMHRPSSPKGFSLYLLTPIRPMKGLGFHAGFTRKIMIHLSH